MDQADAIRRELSGSNQGRGSEPRSRRDRQPRARGREFRAAGQSKPKGPVASERASELGQRWYDLAVAEGFDLPFNANYFALALQRKIERDPEMQPFLRAGKHDQVQRWVAKMIDTWWEPVDEDGRGGYLTNEVTAKNAKDYFLGEDWDDLRYYARSNLRKDYVMKHGKVAPKPFYPQQAEHRARMEEIRREASVKRWLKLNDEADANPREPIDPEARQRLRSWVETKKENRRDKRR